MKKIKDDGVDRISSLTDRVIHHIFSFMDMTEVIQTSILSHRWRYLWKSTPYLNFDSDMMDIFFDSSEDDDYDNDDFFMRKQYRFKVFLTKVFNRRDSSVIDKLRINSNFSLDARNLKNWFGKIRVKKLYLNASIAPAFELPKRLFNSELTSIKLVGYGGDANPSMRLPDTMCSADKLTRLDLMYVKLPDGNEKKEFVFNCPMLEYLCLCECKSSHLDTLTIRAPVLKELDLTGQSYPLCALNICCAALTSFSCGGYLSRPWSLEKVSSLNDARISLYKGKKVEEELFAQYVVEILKGVCGVKSLKISPPVHGIIKNDRFKDDPSMLEFDDAIVEDARCLNGMYVDATNGMFF